MANFKKLLLIVLLIFSGVLLILAGTNLIEVSKDLNLYLGVGLIILAIAYYFLFPSGKIHQPKTSEERKVTDND